MDPHYVSINSGFSLMYTGLLGGKLEVCVSHLPKHTSSMENVKGHYRMTLQSNIMNLHLLLSRKKKSLEESAGHKSSWTTLKQTRAVSTCMHLSAVSQRRCKGKQNQDNTLASHCLDAHP